MSSFVSGSSLDEVEKMVRKEPIEELYDVGPELGRGKFAIVRRCTEKATGQQFAAKYLRKRRGGKSCRPDIMMEVDIVRQCMHHNRIVKLHEVFESTREMIIVLELASGGELFKLIAVDPIPENQAREVVWQLLEGVSHLHTFNVVHLDLKPENILLQRKGSLDIKIADFGLAIQLTPGQQVRNLVGTAEYVAPEILNYEPLTISSDMWSIGALTYALLTGYSPFQGDTHQETFLNVSMCEYDFEDEVFDEVSQDAKDFIEELLRLKPGQRSSAAQCLSHPWIKARNSVTHCQSHEVLNSSTSSLDSALCLDSASSLDPSPISSASSSFAPRPSGTKAAMDDEIKIEDMKMQLTEKMSKLCTETAKAVEVDEGLASSVPLDGSVSSISSTESIRTLVPLEDNKSKSPYDIDKSVTPVGSSRAVVGRSSPDGCSPKMEHHKRHTSDSYSQDEDHRAGSRASSRPSSSLRMSPNVGSDLTSLAPETLEKLKRYEELKQQRRKEQLSSSPSSLRKSSDKAADDDSLKKAASFDTGRVTPKSTSTVENRSPSPVKYASRSHSLDRGGSAKVATAATTRPIVEETTLPKSDSKQTAKIYPVSRKSLSPPCAESTSTSSPTKTPLSSSASSDSCSADDTSRGDKPNDVELRRPRFKHTLHRPSWRQTPHIDPDAIEAILRGEISEDDISESVVSTRTPQNSLETFQEEEEPPPVRVPLTRSQRSTSYSPRSASNIVSSQRERFNCSILKSELKESSSSSSPVRKRVMIVNSTSRNSRAASEDLLKVPSDNVPVKDTRVTKLQSSLSMSRSTPDLSALLTGSMKVARRSTRNEESYVTGSSTSSSSSGSSSRRSPGSNRTTSVRSTLFGGGLVRRFTFSGDKSGRNSRHSPKVSSSKLY